MKESGGGTFKFNWMLALILPFKESTGKKPECKSILIVSPFFSRLRGNCVSGVKPDSGCNSPSAILGAGVANEYSSSKSNNAVPIEESALNRFDALSILPPRTADSFELAFDEAGDFTLASLELMLDVCMLAAGAELSFNGDTMLRCGVTAGTGLSFTGDTMLRSGVTTGARLSWIGEAMLRSGVTAGEKTSFTNETILRFGVVCARLGWVGRSSLTGVTTSLLFVFRLELDLLTVLTLLNGSSSSNLRISEAVFVFFCRLGDFAGIAGGSSSGISGTGLCITGGGRGSSLGTSGTGICSGGSGAVFEGRRSNHSSGGAVERFGGTGALRGRSANPSGKYARCTGPSDLSGEAPDFGWSSRGREGKGV